jgi:hypothetical protein
MYIDDSLVHHNIISKATSKSIITCETCGEPGDNIKIRGWLKVACDKHKEV